MNATEAADELMNGTPPATAGKTSPFAWDLAKLYTERQVAETHRPDKDARFALIARLAAGRDKIAKARSMNMPAETISGAELKMAELTDELTVMMKAEARFYALDMAYSIGRDFLTTLHRTAEGASLTFFIPVAETTFTLALDGPDDEHPF